MICPCCKRSFKPPKRSKQTPQLFSAFVKEALNRTGMTHAEFAHRLGVHASRVPEILRSKNLTEKLFKRCVQALGMTVKVELK